MIKEIDRYSQRKTMQDKQILELIPYFVFIIKEFEYTEKCLQGKKIKRLQRRYNSVKYWNLDE